MLGALLLDTSRLVDLVESPGLSQRTSLRSHTLPHRHGGFKTPTETRPGIHGWPSKPFSTPTVCTALLEEANFSQTVQRQSCHHSKSARARPSHSPPTCLPLLVTPTAAAPASTMSTSAVTATVGVPLAGPNMSRRRSGTALGVTSGPWTGPTTLIAPNAGGSATSIAASSTRHAGPE